MDGKEGKGYFNFKHGGKNSAPKKEEAEEDENAIEVDFMKNYNGIFSLRHLGYFSKHHAICKTIRLCFAYDVPIMAEYILEENAGFLRFYLASKIEEEDEAPNK
jgi:Proliferating cell nuclear antigen, C-terminal domain